MTIKNKFKPFNITVLVLTIIYIPFIFYRSTLSADDSTVESTNVLGLLGSIFEFLGLNMELTDFIVRKAAHFCEFALLGCMVIWVLYLFTDQVVHNLVNTGFICIVIAITDELIQTFSPGRSCQVTDVLVDFSGAVSGVVFFVIVLLIYSRIKKSLERK